MLPSVEERVMRILNGIYPIINSVITGPRGLIVRDRIRKEVTNTVTAIRAENDARWEAADGEATTANEAAIVAARTEEQNRARQQRDSDKIITDKALADAVAAARADEQQKAQQAVSAAQTAAAIDKANALAAAETKRQQDVAAAKVSERAKCVAEIEVAPVSGITIALTLFAGSMRSQIKNYVATGPH